MAGDAGTLVGLVVMQSPYDIGELWRIMRRVMHRHYPGWEFDWAEIVNFLEDCLAGQPGEKR